MRNAVAFRFSQDIGRLAENFVFLELQRRGYEAFYFQKKQDVDFYAHHESEDALLINVAWEMAGRATRQRELAGLQEAMSELGVNRGLLLTERTEEKIKVPEGNIAVRPLWLWAIEAGFRRTEGVLGHSS